VIVSVIAAAVIAVVVVVAVVVFGGVVMVALGEKPLATGERVEDIDGSADGGVVVVVLFLEFRTAARSASRSMV
jgi:uncharacterized protein (DUF1330 family)